ncbi:hypothetical protein [Kitasatospora kifunensis]|uniref:Carotenoid biosynthesis protein n=1 Tax=Kitasatospora kifunensis TaxID=58351 RepID=A0A7W7RAP9_KITKI|nr:hypothetical protein [Kitasatospora kifunensis]MBB4928547.1 hypothetical protein [Kitasatospora kifunensis]
MSSTGLPSVPQASGILIGSTRQNVGNLAVAAFGLAAIVVLAVWAAREYRRKGRPQLWVLLGASLLTVLTDAAARLLTGLQSRPGANGLVLYRAFGIDIAVWMPLFFPAFVGFLGYATYLAIAEGHSRRRFWLILVIGGAADTVGEYVMMHAADLYTYTGAQPLKLFGLPLVWPWAFVSTPMLMGASVALLSHRIHGLRWLLALPLLGSGYLGYLAALFWPVIVARSTGMSSLALSGVGIVSLGFMLATLYVVSLFLPPSSRSGPSAAPATQHATAVN